MTYLIDYNEDHAETILRDADAVCLCHSIAETHDPEKLFESCEKWLSFVRLQVRAIFCPKTSKMVDFRSKILRVVQTQTILFLKSISVRVGTDIQRLRI